jgi:transposase
VAGPWRFDPKVRPLIESDEALSYALLPMLDARPVLYRTFRDLNNKTRHMANDDPVCQRLMTAPGVGFITALTYKAGVDDPTHFRRSRTVAAHFGLTPRRFQSGEIDFDGHISRAGDVDVRSTLYVAANSVLTRCSKWSSLEAWGMKLAKTRGHRRAVIAVASKLAVILHHMCIDDAQFRWSTEAARS